MKKLLIVLFMFVSSVSVRAMEKDEIVQNETDAHLTPDEVLLHAAENEVPGKLKTCLRSCLRMGADINTKNEQGMTALHIASARGIEGFVRYLLEKGANRTLTNKLGETAYDIAHENVKNVLKNYIVIDVLTDDKQKSGSLKKRTAEPLESSKHKRARIG